VSDEYNNDNCVSLSPETPVWSINLDDCPGGKNQLTGEIAIQLLGLSTSSKGFFTSSVVVFVGDYWLDGTYFSQYPAHASDRLLAKNRFQTLRDGSV